MNKQKVTILYERLSRGEAKNRARRFKWVCHKSKRKGTTRVCTCDTSCTDPIYGRCVCTYPAKDFRLYPGIPRGTEHWDNLYRHRVLILDFKSGPISRVFGNPNKQNFFRFSAQGYG